MPKSPASYRLVIFDEIDEPKEARELFCRVTGIHPTDAAQWLARTPGTWPHPLDEATIRQLLDGLYDLAIAAEAWRVDQFPNLGMPRTIHRATCLDDGLRLEGLRGEPTHWIPWDKIEMICAGRINAADENRGIATGRWPSAIVTGIRALALRKPHPSRADHAHHRGHREPLGEILVIRRDPRVAFRFLEDQMNYSYLGDRLANSASENFPVFLADLCARAKDAFLTPSTHLLLGHSSNEEEFEFPSSQSLLDYATHRLLWSWYSRDRDRRNAEHLKGDVEGSGTHDGDPETKGFGSSEFER